MARGGFALSLGVKDSDAEDNKMQFNDRPIHDWYRFVLSFPPHLVRRYLTAFNIENGAHVLDPFCGTGTTLVECKKLGIQSSGIEANPMACLASRVKTNWDVEPDLLTKHARKISNRAESRLSAEGHETAGLPLFSGSGTIGPLIGLPPDKERLLLRGSISPLPLHKTLVLLEELRRCKIDSIYEHEQVALAKSLVNGIGNLCFGPEVGVGRAKSDAPVLSLWMDNIRAMAADLRSADNPSAAATHVFLGDARNAALFLDANSVDAIITSPPYPNEKDYTRTTRLESVILGIVNSKQDLQSVKRSLVRSNTRGVYRDDDDNNLVATNPEVEQIAEEIERRRLEMKKNSGFERMYARVTRLYFGGMARHLAQMRSILRPGAQLAYVVGDQASYLQVMIRTGTLLADIATGLGYKVMGIELFRTRLATATKQQLREEVVLLQWNPRKRIRKGNCCVHKGKSL